MKAGRDCHKVNDEVCSCPVKGRINRFVQPALLLLLLEKPSYGYELMERISEIGLLDAPTDPALIYRTLRRLEEEKFVSSQWQTGESGPAKRCYQLTDEGIQLLHQWADEIERRRRSMDHFLDRYKKHFSQHVDAVSC